MSGWVRETSTPVLQFVRDAVIKLIEIGEEKNPIIFHEDHHTVKQYVYWFVLSFWHYPVCTC